MKLNTNSSPAIELQNEQQLDPWQQAYLRFETPEEEVRKFTRRLLELRVNEWPKNLRIVELFCGRGNGLKAWERLGFQNIEGVDQSSRLIREYRGPAKCYAADCRSLPFAPESKDVAVVQGGLHHLTSLPDDLERTCAEIRRILTRDGSVLFVEPWLTPFLGFVHLVMKSKIARHVSPKLDALAVMVAYEQRTYTQWLSQPVEIRTVVLKYFFPLCESFAWGKWYFHGKPC